MNGFEDSGVYPINRDVVLSQIKDNRGLRMKPTLPSLVPTEQRFGEAIQTAERLHERYFELLSSPSRAGLRTIRKVVSEAPLLYDHIQSRKRADVEREATLDRKMRRRIYKIPQTGDSLSLSKGELSQLALQRAHKEAEADRKKQDKAIRNLNRKTEAQLKEMWRGDLVNGKGKKTWKVWVAEYREAHKED